MDTGLIVYFVLFSLLGGGAIVFFLLCLGPKWLQKFVFQDMRYFFCRDMPSFSLKLWRLSRIPGCLYFLTPTEYRADAEKKSYDDYRNGPRYMCFCDRSVCLYQFWHLKNRIFNKLRNLICGIGSSPNLPADSVLPISQCSTLQKSLPLPSSSAAPVTISGAVTM
ncbi:hypothetical protein BJV82DRAFT_608430 [Fennellomyces sp. T-0311]|nr:hypothetical protein BJV82DRAFT_608430 [Fennellomyces sp. T-0311]